MLRKELRAIHGSIALWAKLTAGRKHYLHVSVATGSGLLFYYDALYEVMGRHYSLASTWVRDDRGLVLASKSDNLCLCALTSDQSPTNTRKLFVFYPSLKWIKDHCRLRANEVLHATINSFFTSKNPLPVLSDKALLREKNFRFIACDRAKDGNLKAGLLTEFVGQRQRALLGYENNLAVDKLSFSPFRGGIIFSGEPSGWHHSFYCWVRLRAGSLASK